MYGIILAGGYGKRLMPLTKRKRKPFIEILGKPLFHYTIEYLYEAGVTNLLIIGRPGDEFHASYKVQVKTIAQDGSGEDNAIKKAYPYVKEEDREGPYVTAFTGFISTPPDIVKYALQYHYESNYPNTIIVTPIVSGLETYGEVIISGDRAEGFKKEQGKSGYVFAGVLILNKQGLEAIYSEGFTPGLNHLSKNGKLGVYIWSGKWIEIGYPWDLLEAGTVLLEHRLRNNIKVSKGAKVSPTSIIKGPVLIEENAFIDEGAYIQGPAYIGENAFVGFSTYIRPYSIIERNTIIGSKNEVKRSIIMQKTRTSTGVIIADTIIGENCDIREYSVFQSSHITNLPPRIRDKVYYRHKKPKLGSIISPNCTVGPLAKINPGDIIDCNNPN
ncbi:MAG: NTP transferase domain-containing protein [Desulfurococcales archaeon]|nr:NTP transferase domain-containing protein [Desulfurococcales archaeon]